VASCLHPAKAEADWAARQLPRFENVRPNGQGVAVVEWQKIFENLHVATARVNTGKAMRLLQAPLTREYHDPTDYGRSSGPPPIIVKRLMARPALSNATQASIIEWRGVVASAVLMIMRYRNG